MVELTVRTGIVAILCACGGQVAQGAGDGSSTTDATIVDERVTTDAFGDGDETGPPYTVIDGGACDAPDGALWELETCCNGSLCQGQCVVFADSSTPACWCAGVVGGCPDGWVCCYSDDGTHALVCNAGCPYHGPVK